MEKSEGKIRDALFNANCVAITKVGETVGIQVTAISDIMMKLKAVLPGADFQGQVELLAVVEE